MAIITKQPQTKQQNGQQRAKAQVLEQLRSVADGTLNSLTQDVLKETPQEFFKQMLGISEKHVSGDLVPGEALEIKEALSGKYEENKKLASQLSLERQMRQDEQKLASKKGQELQLQLSALKSEVGQLAQTTQGLSREVQIAAFQAPVEPGTYHVIFFEKLISFIRDFRKNIENASVWIASYNLRAKKRAHTFWGQVGIGGAKRLLSSEDYSQRAVA